MTLSLIVVDPWNSSGGGRVIPEPPSSPPTLAETMHFNCSEVKAIGYIEICCNICSHDRTTSIPGCDRVADGRAVSSGNLGGRLDSLLQAARKEMSRQVWAYRLQRIACGGLGHVTEWVVALDAPRPTVQPFRSRHILGPGIERIVWRWRRVPFWIVAWFSRSDGRGRTRLPRWPKLCAGGICVVSRVAVAVRVEIGASLDPNWVPAQEPSQPGLGRVGLAHHEQVFRRGAHPP